MRAALLGVAVLWVSPPARRWPAAGAAAAFAVQPVLTTLALAGGWIAVRWSRMAAARRATARTVEDAVVLAELTALGLTAGLTFSAALAAARPHVNAALQAEVDGVLRASRNHGVARALADGGGAAGALFVAAARAVATGAPLAAAVALHVREARANLHADRLARARRLPVRMMLPLALLILPGFVLVAIAPAVLSAFDRIVLPR